MAVDIRINEKYRLASDAWGWEVSGVKSLSGNLSDFRSFDTLPDAIAWLIDGIARDSNATTIDGLKADVSDALGRLGPLLDLGR